MGERFPLRVGITIHSAAPNRLTLPSLPNLRPVANGGSFFEKRRPDSEAGLDSFTAIDRHMKPANRTRTSGLPRVSAGVAG
jgi:hypothetical protein